MSATVASLWRYPVKGFSPERVARARLEAGGFFPFDRLYAVENGPSGFDPAAPAFVSKSKFTVLAKIAKVAAARTRFVEAGHTFHAEAAGFEPIAARLLDEEGRAEFAAWLTVFLGAEVRGPLKVVAALDTDHRFTDHPQGCISMINLASVDDLAKRLGRPVDPLRFRANLYVEGLAPWAEMAWEGKGVRIGDAAFSVFKTIVRCAATHVDPETATRDLDLVAALHHFYGHMDCGVYLHCIAGGDVGEGALVGSP